MIDIKQIQTVLRPDQLWQRAWELGYAVALWRLPRQSDRHLIVQATEQVAQTRLILEEMPMGFAVAPFDNPEGKHTYFIEADYYARFGESEIIEETVKQEAAILIEPLFQQSAKDLLPTEWYPSSRLPTWNDSEATDFCEAVAKAVDTIQEGIFQKVVLSRRKTVSLADSFRVTDAFLQLCDAYPNAFVSLFYLPNLNEVWLCATPEVLVSLDENGQFKTVALAGTQSALDPQEQPIPVKHAQWTQKEIEEQALVSRYIIDCFKKIRVREYVEEGPKTVIAGNLMHLRTDYTVDTNAIHFPQMGTVMLDLLHPTSAVCGMPKAPALKFIREHEGYNRGLYSGFVGPVNVANASHLFVHLRCAKIEAKTATIYVGAGITEDSIPEKEWFETEMKSQTLGRFLQNQHSENSANRSDI